MPALPATGCKGYVESLKDHNESGIRIKTFKIVRIVRAAENNPLPFGLVNRSPDANGFNMVVGTPVTFDIDRSGNYINVRVAPSHAGVYGVS